MVFQLQWKRGGSAGLLAHPKDEQLITTEVRKICWLCHAGTNWLRCCSNKGFLADLKNTSNRFGARKEVSSISFQHSTVELAFSDLAEWMCYTRKFAESSLLFRPFSSDWKNLIIDYPATGKETARIWLHVATSLGMSCHDLNYTITIQYHSNSIIHDNCISSFIPRNHGETLLPGPHLTASSSSWASNIQRLVTWRELGRWAPQIPMHFAHANRAMPMCSEAKSCWLWPLQLVDFCNEPWRWRGILQHLNLVNCPWMYWTSKLQQTKSWSIFVLHTYMLIRMGYQ